MTCCTCERVASATRGLSLSTIDTVPVATPASRAMSLSVMRLAGAWITVRRRSVVGARTSRGRDGQSGRGRGWPGGHERIRETELFAQALRHEGRHRRLDHLQRAAGVDLVAAQVGV